MTLMDKIKRKIGPEPESAIRRKLYQTLKVLGQGSFGIVKEAIEISTNKHVAMKSILKKNTDSNAAAVAMRDCTKIIYSILDALSFLHHHDIVHRDLKPENILLKNKSDDLKIVIADFGVSNFIEDDEVLNTLCGSPGYAAPELHPFYYTNDLPELLECISNARYTFESPYWDHISQEAKDFITCLLKVDPSRRPTAQLAKCHKWLVKYNPKAKENVDKIKNLLREKKALQEKQLEEEKQKYLEVQEAPLLASSTSVSNLSDLPTQEDEIEELLSKPVVKSVEAIEADAELPNLVKDWDTDGEKSNLNPFNAKVTFKRAISLVKTAARLGSVKRLNSQKECDRSLKESHEILHSELDLKVDDVVEDSSISEIDEKLKDL
ncbi:Calcium/calmodulin-dependent protein kinase type 1 [Clydaea vesicula]|uniref:Calcium/calmodulin-dependent protein kinase type 1 n=1 Tax=Clydaea vesicula TaxID=447962 RepID=A0AAD5U9I8_9FUNG|nr:Calcium/calmodulin-dependent protein kinase type 1 [Clydaea vesicula]